MEDQAAARPRNPAFVPNINSGWMQAWTFNVKCDKDGIESTSVLYQTQTAIERSLKRGFLKRRIPFTSHDIGGYGDTIGKDVGAWHKKGNQKETYKF